LIGLNLRLFPNPRMSLGTPVYIYIFCAPEVFLWGGLGWTSTGPDWLNPCPPSKNLAAPLDF